MYPTVFKRIFSIALLIATAISGLLMTSSPATLASTPTAESILDKADAIRFPQASLQVDVKIVTEFTGGRVEERIYRVLSKGNDKTVILTLAPASERGQMMLMRERDLWVFMPRVSQPIRLPLSQKLAGQVANGDLARANFVGDYDPTLLRTEKEDGREFYVLELNAVDRGVTYPQVIYWVDTETFRPHKAEFYTLSGRLLKTARYTDFDAMGGEIRPTTLLMTDALREGETSAMKYGNMKLRGLSDKVFTKDYLKKLSQ